MRFVWFEIRAFCLYSSLSVCTKSKSKDSTTILRKKNNVTTCRIGCLSPARCTCLGHTHARFAYTILRDPACQETMYVYMFIIATVSVC